MYIIILRRWAMDAETKEIYIDSERVIGPFDTEDKAIAKAKQITAQKTEHDPYVFCVEPD